MTCYIVTVSADVHDFNKMARRLMNTNQNANHNS